MIRRIGSPCNSTLRGAAKVAIKKIGVRTSLSWKLSEKSRLGDVSFDENMKEVRSRIRTEGLVRSMGGIAS